jgi:hypothetical protein
MFERGQFAWDAAAKNEQRGGQGKLAIRLSDSVGAAG